MALPAGCCCFGYPLSHWPSTNGRWWYHHAGIRCPVWRLHHFWLVVAVWVPVPRWGTSAEDVAILSLAHRLNSSLFPCHILSSVCGGGGGGERDLQSWAVPLIARLETRTKESMECAEVAWQTEEASYHRAWWRQSMITTVVCCCSAGWLAGIQRGTAAEAAAAYVSVPDWIWLQGITGPEVLLHRVLSACMVLGTRKVVNYTILQRSHGKLWWRLVRCSDVQIV